MHLIILFFATFSAAFMATVPPGLLNLNAAQISVKKGRNAAIYFSIGVMLVICIQAYIAVLISRYLYNNPSVIDLLLKIAIVIFASLAVYFYVLARKNREIKRKPVKISKKNSFFKGFLLASINLLAIPYYSGLNAAWNASGWIKFEWEDIVVFMLAAGSGSFAVLYIYIIYFSLVEIKTDRFSKYSDYILSAMMLVLFVITLIRIFYSE
jgi:threonine/homoserine/homoserine lactone efflux protein